MVLGEDDKWFLNNTYTELGTYQYDIWGKDTSDNWDTLWQGTFVVFDPVPPQIENVMAVPDPQELNDIPAIRQDRVNSIRAAIADGTYETDAKLSTALDRLLDEIG